ncbi:MULTISPECIES: helix-turn-helix domain-containing protein [Halocynthiibacter]|uniref:Helix-turn-helix transcriptional regulator n=1 Tax=Halocynthiibacter halioticoli TaxID=2986804 RepID=A0AAE3J246_9RHOB|nr:MULTISPECIES: helix-turn-helix transcriptional regulator [Halocynthiibacter]MCV6826024.1 helix-turn-helix transcriptional regulator [Halocynthiibacter halioticoli]MCW4059025.1 helix-turn-helix transcriptional regulator [Halocynthiibacter sp. SDUM655004]
MHNQRNMDIDDLIVANLKRLILEKQTNTSALAKAAGMNHTAVRDILTRKAKSPKYATLVKLANALDVPVWEITGGDRSANLTPEERRMLFAMSQLSDEIREVLLKSAEAQIPDPEKGK